MSVIFEHLPFYREIFTIKDFWKEPFLLIGIPRMDGVYMPKDFDYSDLIELLKDKGLKNISALDYFDPQADIKFDLNKPVPKKYQNKYKVLFDMGSIEHVFDTKQCLENYFRMIKKDGLFVLVTSINGYYGHGIHVFNPETIKEALKLNGFKIVYSKYSTSTGRKMDYIDTKKNMLIWVAAKKTKNMGKDFVVPQQTKWEKKYKKGQTREKPTVLNKLKFGLRYLKFMLRG